MLLERSNRRRSYANQGLMDRLLSLAALVTVASSAAAEECPCLLFPDEKDTYKCEDPSLTQVPACVPDTTTFLQIESPIPLVPESLSRFANLTELHVVNRDVDFVAADFIWYNAKLVVFEFFYTGLERVDKEWFRRATQVRAVSFDYNRLATLPEDSFSYLPQVSAIFLRNNNLTSLSPSVFGDASSLRHVYLVSNPWHCDCALATFVRWTRDRNVALPGSPTCSTPEDLRGLPLADIEQQQLCP